MFLFGIVVDGTLASEALFHAIQNDLDDLVVCSEA